jgi:nucleotide-binding universal stress UspA family protein
MKLLSKVLFVAEFGRGDQAALKTIEALSARFRSQVLLVHVIPAVFDPPSRKQQATEAGMDRLMGVAESLSRKAVSVLDETVLYGEPIEQIARYAQSQQVNVIVVPTDRHTSGPGARALALMRYTEKPVWAVREGAEGPPSRILCPVRGLEACHRALRNSIHLARQFNAHLDVLTVRDPSSDETPEPEGFKLIDQMLGDHDITGVDLQQHVRLGRPHAEILAMARRRRTDLLVMGSAGRLRMMTLLLGSVASRILAEAPCSVVTLRAEEAVRLERDRRPGDATLQLKRGQDLLAHGFPREAIEELELALDLEPTLIAAWRTKAEAHNRLAEYAQARRSARLSDALSKMPSPEASEM